MRLSSLRMSWARLSARAGERVSRALPPFVSLAPSHTRRCTWRGGKRVECLLNFESASKNAPTFIVVCVPVGVCYFLIGHLGLSTAG